MHDAGAVEQDVDRAGIARRLRDRIGTQHIEPGGADVVGCDRLDLRGIDIGGDHARTRGGEGKRGGATDALTGGSDEGGLVG